MKSRILASGIAACMLVFVASPAFAADTAVLKITRSLSMFGRYNNMQVYVNDKYLGAVDNGKTKDFKFTPAKDGKNKLNAVITSLFRVPSTDYQFTAKAGSVVNAVTSVKEGSFTCTLLIDLKSAKRPTKKYKLISVKMDKQMKSVDLKESPVYRLPSGQEKVVEDTLRLRHTVSCTLTKSLEAELKADLVAVQASIRGGIQKSNSRSYSVESELKRSVKLIGNGQPLKVVWCELYRTGTAVIEVKGKRQTVPFTYKEDFDLKVKLAQ